MTTTSTLTIGEIEITPVSDGTLDAGMGGILRLDPADAKRLVDAAREATGVNPVILPVRTFLVRTPERLALVDTGSGNNKGPTMGHLPKSLEALGVKPDDIETVLLTHLHMDHAGGLTNPGGRAAFPNAELVVHEKEADYWLDTPKERIDARSLRTVDHVRAMVSTYGDRVRRIADGEGIDGVAAELAPGHTPGHTTWLVTSGGQSALILGDVIHLAAVQLPRPDSAMIYDVNADGAVASRQRVLARLAKEGVIACGMHLPDPGFGRIHQDGNSYRFEPFC